MKKTQVARPLAYVTGSVNQQLLLQNEYLLAENRILRGHLPTRLLLTDPERSTLAMLGKSLGRQGLEPVASAAKPATPDVVMACCGDVPTLETLAAVSILREHLPDLKIRVVNVVDLMKLQPQTEHPHGLSDMDFDELFTKDKPVIFAFHAVVRKYSARENQ